MFPICSRLQLVNDRAAQAAKLPNEQREFFTTPTGHSSLSALGCASGLPFIGILPGVTLLRSSTPGYELSPTNVGF